MKHLYKLRSAMLLLCLVAIALIQSAPLLAQVQTPRYISMTANTKGYYEYLPQGYDPASSTTYPLLIFIHGAGETGDGSPSSLPKVLYNGPPRLINQGTFPTSFNVNGQTHKFIVISPQFVGWPGHPDIQAIINYLVQNYRVNTNRIYLTGLSMGGGATWDYAGENVTYANRLAAILPICGASYPEHSRARHMAEGNLPVWALHNDQDGTVPVSYTNDYIRQINEAPAPNPAAKKTIFQSTSHDAWSRAYDPNFREAGLNVYEWMLSYSRGNSTQSPSANQFPVANAGADVNLILPANSTQLNGNASSDPDGSINSYSWARISGPTQFTFNNSNIVNPQLSNLVAGNYMFRLTITDNSGATATDDVAINVTAVNQAPVANAGPDVTLTLPANSTQLNGNGSSDPDGSISSYSWAKVSGPAQFALNNSNIVNPVASNLVAGTYVLRLTVTDNRGATATDDITININAAPATNQPPRVYAGPGISITLPVNTANLDADGTDPDGTIISYTWTKISGPAGGVIVSPSQAKTGITNLGVGNYTFQVKVTDNGGATATDNLIIEVYPGSNPSPNQTPRVYAGPSISVTLPVNTATLNADGSDPDGTIVSYAWTKLSGPAGGNIVSPSQALTGITNLGIGNYVYQVKVTDNAGATATDNLTIEVYAGANQAPVVSASPAQTITLPVNNVTVSATASDADGSIASYEWTKISGPAAGTIASSTQAQTAISNLAQGVYTFQVKVTDNNGATATATVSITVNPALAIPPPPSTGTTKFIKVNVYGGQNPYNYSEWNNWNAGGTSNISSGAFKYSDGSNSGISAVISQQVSISDNSDNYGGGMAPAEVLRYSSYASSPRSLTINGLTPAKSYNLELYASRVINTSETTIYSIGQASITIQSYNNHDNKAVFNSLTADGQGRIVVSIINGVSFNYLNGFILTDGNTTAPANQSPVANAGADINLMLPANSAQLNGGGSSDPDGTISAYNWTVIGGPGQFSLSNSGIVNPLLSNLVAGVYTLRLTVTDNAGAMSTDDVVVNVTAAANQSPTVYAGPGVSITLPANSVTVTANGNDPDGTITSYAWTKLSGPASGTITNPAQAQTGITGLTAGTYTFQVKVTDNNGATATDNLVVNVSGAANQSPTVYAGPGLSITLPANSVTVTANGNDPDGTITSYAWTKLSGPASGSIASPAQAQTNITGLTAGTYTFQVKVTDNGGATATSNISILVNDAVVTPPVNTTKYIKVNVYGGQSPYNNSEWNNWSTGTATSNIVSGTFKYSDGSNSSVFASLSSQIAISDNAANYTGGMAPAEVLRFTSYASGIRTLTISGLAPSKVYNLELYASRVINTSEATTYTIGQVSSTVQSFNNHDKKAVFNSLASDAQGRIVVSIKNEVSFNYLNGFILTEAGSASLVTTAQPGVDQPLITENSRKELNIYPNPVNDNFLLVLNNTYKGQVNVQIADISGSIKKTYSFTKDQLTVQKQFNISGLVAGTYVVIVQSGVKKQSLKLLKL